MRHAVVLIAAAGILLVGRPAFAHEFLIYFDRGSATVPPRYHHVVTDAARYVSPAGTAAVVIHAHADGLGSAADNQALSRRRAEAIAEMLERLGVPRPRIVLRSYGETMPAVAAGDGADEPLNRRAVISPPGLAN